MLRGLGVIAVFALIGAGGAAAQTALGLPVSGVQTIQLSDQVGKNQIQFISSSPLEEILGTASGVSGTLTLNPKNIEAMTGHIAVPVARMETGIKKRDGHLLSAEWLNAEAFPVIAFDLKGLKDVTVKTDPGKAVIKGTAVGDFSLHGVTKAMAIPFEATYLTASEQTKQRAPGDLFAVQGAFKIALKDFNIEGTRGMIGSRVGSEIDLKANFFGSTAIPAEAKKE